MPSYAALLRECADTLAQSDGSLARARKAAQLRALAALLERVTPERMELFTHDLEETVLSVEGQVIYRTTRELASGPQGEADHG